MTIDNPNIVSESQLTPDLTSKSDFYVNPISSDLNKLFNVREGKGFIQDTILTAKFFGFNETLQGVKDRFVSSITPNDGKFNSWQSPKLDKYPLEFLEQYSSRIDRAGTDEELDDALAKIEERRNLEKEFAESDLNNFAVTVGFVGGVFGDATVLAVPGAFVYKAGLTVKAGAAIYAAQSATVLGGAAALRDYMSSDRTPSTEDKLYNVGAAALFGGVIGGSVGYAVGKAAINTAKVGAVQAVNEAKIIESKAAIKNEAQDLIIKRSEEIDQAVDAISPQSTYKQNIGFDDILNSDVEVEIIKPEGVISKAVFNFFSENKYLKHISPEQTVFASKNPAVRALGQAMFGTNLQTNLPSSVPMLHMSVVESERISRTAFMNLDNVWMAARAELGIKLKSDELDALMYKGVISGDYNSAPKELVPYLTKAREEYKKTMDELLDNGKKSGAIAKDAKFDPTKAYRHNSPDYDIIQKDSSGAKELYAKAILKENTRLLNKFREEFVEQVDGVNLVDVAEKIRKYRKLSAAEQKLAATGGKFSKDVLKEIKSLRKFLNKKEVVAAREKYAVKIRQFNEYTRLSKEVNATKAAEAIVDDMLFATSTGVARIAEAGSLKFRNVAMDLDILEPVLNKDLRSAIQNTVRSQTVAHVINANLGETNFVNTFRKLDEAAKNYIIKNKLTGDKAKEILEDLKAEKQAFITVYNRMNGRQANGAIANSTADQAANYVRVGATVGLMRKSFLSQIPDLASVKFNWKTISPEAEKDFEKLFKSTGGKLDNIQKERLAFRSDISLNTRFEALNSSDGYALSNAAKLPAKITSTFYWANLMTWANNTMEGMAVDNVIDALVKLSSKTGKLTDEEIGILKDMGIAADDLPKILAQAKKYSTKTDNGVLSYGLADWEGSIGVRARAAIYREMRKSVIAPNAAARPAIIDNSWLGRFFGQFKGFMFSGFRNFLQKDLQQGIPTWAARTLVRSFGGTTAYMARELLTKDFSDIDISVPRLIQEGLMRGGGLAGIDTILDLLDSFNLGPSRVLGTSRSGERSRGFGNQGADPVTRAVVGAPLVPIADLSNTIGAISQGRTDYNAYKHMMKYVYGHFLIEAAYKRGIEPDIIKESKRKREAELKKEGK